MYCIRVRLVNVCLCLYHIFASRTDVPYNKLNNQLTQVRKRTRCMRSRACVRCVIVGRRPCHHRDRQTCKRTHTSAPILRDTDATAATTTQRYVNAR